MAGARQSIKTVDSSAFITWSNAKFAAECSARITKNTNAKKLPEMDMKVFLVESDPHPTRIAHIYRDWWGKEIELGAPEKPLKKHICDTHTIWPVIGPKEFLDLLARYNLGRYVCVHLIAGKVHSNGNG